MILGVSELAYGAVCLLATIETIVQSLIGGIACLMKKINEELFTSDFIEARFDGAYYSLQAVGYSFCSLWVNFTEDFVERNKIDRIFDAAIRSLKNMYDRCCFNSNVHVPPLYDDEDETL
jgi:hypothetical protein